MNLKKSLLIALFSFGIAQSALAETDSEKFDRAMQLHNQQNYSAAFPLFKQLAEQGDADAQLHLGNMYSGGKGVTKNRKQANYWYEKAAKQGHAIAQVNLGINYEYGFGVRRDLSKAKELYGQACDSTGELGCKVYARLDEQGIR